MLITNASLHRHCCFSLINSLRGLKGSPKLRSYQSNCFWLIICLCTIESVDQIQFLFLDTKDSAKGSEPQEIRIIKMMHSKFKLPSTKTVISTAASVAATGMLVRSLVNDFIPRELRQHYFTKIHLFLSTFTSEITLIIDEFDGLVKNQLFYAAESYLAAIGSSSTKTFRASVPEKEKKIHISIGGNEDVIDKFCGFQLTWRMVQKQDQHRQVPSPDEYYFSTIRAEVKYLELTFHKKHKNKVFDEYLPYVLERSKAVKEGERTLKLHTLKNDTRVHGPPRNPWQAVNLDHSATFETLAMDDEIKKMVIDDLDRFLKRKEFYKKVGKSWKRGYLLFGPPGTGKSSLIAAMANYLNFDVYDLELTDLRCNSDLRRLLIWTANRSILVVEDIDASIDLSERNTPPPPPKRHPSMYPHQHNQEPKVTLSGLLNFTDGLWSSCGDERIIIFTTNHIDKLDPALLRPGRMDVHIHMSYCTPCGFKMLVSNYLGNMDHHPLVSKAEGMISITNVTPAEVAEQLLKNDDPEHALQGLIEFLELKKEGERVKAESLEVTKREVVENLEDNDDESEMYPKNVNGHKELVRISQASPAEMRKQLLKNNEVVNALKVLIGILEGVNGNGDTKDSDSSSRSTGVVSVPKSEKEGESKAE